MGYTWEGMRKMSWEEVQAQHKEPLGLTGFFYLYDDNTEAEIPEDYAWEHIENHHNAGGEFGEEL